MRISDWSSDVCSSDLIAPPDRMPRVRSDAGIKHMTNFGLLLEPVDELQSVALMALEAHLKRAQSAMHEVAIVRAHAVSPVTRRILQPPEDVGIRRGHCAEHDVGMSRKIFGRCSDRHIDALFNRPEIERGDRKSGGVGKR